MSLGGAALLVALPQSPETRRLDRFPAPRATRTRPRSCLVEDGARAHVGMRVQVKAALVPRLRMLLPILAPHSRAVKPSAPPKDSPS